MAKSSIDIAVEHARLREMTIFELRVPQKSALWRAGCVIDAFVEELNLAEFMVISIGFS